MHFLIQRYGLGLFNLMGFAEGEGFVGRVQRIKFGAALPMLIIDRTALLLGM